MLNNDIARGRLEDELLRGSAVLRSLPDGVVICDRAGIVRFINPAGARLLQIDVDACVGQSVGALPGGIAVPSDYSDQETGQFIEIEYEQLRCKIIPIWSEKRKQEQIGFLIVIKVVCLETISLEDLRTIIAYEFRTPLTSITGCTDIVLRALADGLSDQQRGIIQIANNQSKRLYDLINSLVSVLVFDSGRMHLSVEETNVSDIVQEVMDSKKTLVHNKDIAIEVKISSDLLLVHVDGYKLRDILSHLLDNAYRYTPSGGNVIVNVRIAADQLHCDIQDTGIGISESVQARVFTRPVNDYRNPLRDKIDHYSGVGLGLVIAKRLVDLHGGKVWFVSAVGQGSTFSFTLPLYNQV